MIAGLGSTRWALGLMSGTSMDGIDAALLRTDGLRIDEHGPNLTLPYDEPFRERLRACLGGVGPVLEVERELTERHADAVDALLEQARLDPSDVGVIGFHGHTILHAPEERLTWQIGNGQLLARLTGIPVVNDFRAADMAKGGQGAPLVPLYHLALALKLPRPLAVLNLGGVGNVTWIGEDSRLMAFDTGPGNAMLDDWVLRHGGMSFDPEGSISGVGRVDEASLARLMEHPYLAAKPPKSLDRNAFETLTPRGLSLEDGAATLAAFSVECVAAALRHLPAAPVRWLVTGGGRHNETIMRGLRQRLNTLVDPVEIVGWNGDALEAEAFAFLAARSVAALPLTLPETTGTKRPLTGGRLFLP